VLGADTKYTTGGIVNYGEKIFPLSSRSKYRVVVAGAGDVGFIRAASQKIDEALPPNANSLESVTTIIEAANKRFYENYILPHPPERTTYELLVAVAFDNNQRQLLKTSENTTATVSQFAAIGTGGITAEPYTKMWRDDLSAFEAELMAAFLIRYAMSYDEYSGGDTRIYCLLGPELYKLDSTYIDMADDYFKEFNKLAIDLILPHQVFDTEPEYYESGIAGIARFSAHQRRNLVRSHIKAHIRVP
jgi:20S proteasome alpha/beta subunit